MHQRLSAFLVALMIGLGAFASQAFAEKQPAYCSSFKDSKCRAGCYGRGWYAGCHDYCTKKYKECGYKETAEEQSKALRDEKENLEKTIRCQKAVIACVKACNGNQKCAVECKEKDQKVHQACVAKP